MRKSPEAFRTIGEVASWLGVPPHVLRFWESKFTQVRPVKRAGGRRYYRRGDMALLGGIKVLLHDRGMTIKGVQRILSEDGPGAVVAHAPELEPDPGAAASVEEAVASGGDGMERAGNGRAMSSDRPGPTRTSIVRRGATAEAFGAAHGPDPASAGPRGDAGRSPASLGEAEGEVAVLPAPEGDGAARPTPGFGADGEPSRAKVEPVAADATAHDDPDRANPPPDERSGRIPPPAPVEQDGEPHDLFDALRRDGSGPVASPSRPGDTGAEASDMDGWKADGEAEARSDDDASTKKGRHGTGPNGGDALIDISPSGRTDDGADVAPQDPPPASAADDVDSPDRDRGEALGAEGVPSEGDASPDRPSADASEEDPAAGPDGASPDEAVDHADGTPEPAPAAEGEAAEDRLPRDGAEEPQELDQPSDARSGADPKGDPAPGRRPRPHGPTVRRNHDAVLALVRRLEAVRDRMDP